jgi:hypothetical protein
MLRIITLLLVSACASAPTVPSTDVPAPSEPVSVAPPDDAPTVAPANEGPAFPMPRERLVDRTLPYSEHARVLADGRSVVVIDNEIVMTNRVGEVVRNIGTEGRSQDFIAIDPGGHFVVWRWGTTDLETGLAHTLPDGQAYITCDSDVARCIRVDAVPVASMHIRVVPMGGAPEPAGFTVRCTRIGLGRSCNALARWQSLSLATLVGDVLELRSQDLSAYTRCAFDLAQGILLGCREHIREAAAEEDEEAASPHVGPAPVRGWFELYSQDDAFFFSVAGEPSNTLRLDAQGAQPAPTTDRRRNAHHWPMDTLWRARIRAGREQRGIVAEFARTHADAEAITVSTTASRGPTFAFVERGMLRVTDTEGHDVFPARRLPVQPGDTPVLSFITDVDLACDFRSDRERVRPTRPLWIHLPDGHEKRLRDFTGLTFATTRDGDRAAFVAADRIRVLDARTGATLLDVEDGMWSPSIAQFSEDGRRLIVLNDQRSFALLDVSALTPLSATGVASSPIGRVEHVDGYDPVDDVLYVCRDRTLRVVFPFSPERTIALPFDACEPDPFPMPLVFIPGYVGVQRRDVVSFIRLRDGETLDLQIIASSTDIAAILLRDTTALGVYPDDTPLVRVHDPAARDAVQQAQPSASIVEAAVRAFFSP